MKKFINKIYRILSGLILLYKASILLKKKFSDVEILMFFPFYHIGGAEKVHLDIVKSVGNSKKVAVLFTNKSASEEFKNEFFKSAICIDIFQEFD